ncbi:uncharacterized protein LOC120777807 isoform X2 [Bactrocera tryoni]|uniref:uncharacterized protein LOC120777807 isoform X2 n=1 Tax=Bactrocera tryoni TaxID=59916 RepID=UPI001A98EDD9|nr:uncharacterized protein LOC120777807 isoform X2 [Bactrocera tryoni]
MTTSMQLYRYSFTAGAFAAGGSFFGRAPSQLSELPALTSAFAPTAAATYYLALQCTEHTLTATVLTAATNYMFSFILGALVYREEITLMSTVGAIFIITGLWFLCKAQEEQKLSAKHEKLH